MRKFVVVGSGIAGMYAALRIKRLDSSHCVTLLETQDKLGGLLAGIDINGIHFDTGVHTFYETGNPELDDLLYSIVPSGGWVDLVGINRDLGGAYFAGSMHFGNAYIGFEHLGEKERKTLEKEFLELPSPKNDVNQVASEYLINRFGETLSKSHLLPVVEKFTGRAADSVHSNVTSILPLGRINLLSEQIDSRILSGEDYNSRLSFSDQRKIPKELIPDRKAFYPRSYGTQLYVDAFEKRLLELGVKILKSIEISEIYKTSIVIRDSQRIEFDELIWTANPLSIARFTKSGIKPPKLVPIQKTAVVSYLINSEPNMKDLYYAYSHEPRHLTHRFSSPVTFCEQSKILDSYRFTNEIVFHDNLDESEIERISTSELQQIGIFEKSDIRGAKVTKISGGYPDLSAELVNDALTNIEELKSAVSRNIHFVGMLSKANLFFQNDILINTHEVVESLG